MQFSTVIGRFAYFLLSYICMYYGLYRFIYIDVKMILLTLSDQIALYSSLFFLEM